MSLSSLLHRASRNPEANVFLFSFLLNFVWEMWQVPFYVGMATVDHIQGVRVCTQASFGDAVISVLAFWGGAFAARSRGWILRIRATPVLVFWAIGIVVTISLEWLATGMLDRWEYSPGMPRLPVIGTGILPLLQWTLLPAAIIFLVRRQISVQEADHKEV